MDTNLTQEGMDPLLHHLSNPTISLPFSNAKPVSVAYPQNRFFSLTARPLHPSPPVATPMVYYTRTPKARFAYPNRDYSLSSQILLVQDPELKFVVLGALGKISMGLLSS